MIMKNEMRRGGKEKKRMQVRRGEKGKSTEGKEKRVNGGERGRTGAEKRRSKRTKSKRMVVGTSDQDECREQAWSK